jgi:hypothetical protein
MAGVLGRHWHAIATFGSLRACMEAYGRAARAVECLKLAVFGRPDAGLGRMVIKWRRCLVCGDRQHSFFLG